MSDIVVTVPKGQWPEWIEEGDLPGEEPPEFVSHFWLRTLPAELQIGGPNPTRVYVVSHGRLRGYAPLVDMEESCLLNRSRACVMRAGGARAVTIPETIAGFRGFRYRWWSRDEEEPFPDWQTNGVT